ncbi:MAG: helix-turn-helix transcriptional regulator [Fusobacteriaceae bacterium]|nr:helix-turn-helix transcriptional regulator [Fusobacteriaceae bacterium]
MLTDRQKKIIEIVKKNQPIKGDDIAKELGVTRSALRTDFSILTKENIIEAKVKKGYYYKEKKDFRYVKEIMSSPIMIDLNTSVYDTIINMFTEDVGSIFVIQKDSLVGVVSRKDLLKSVIGNLDINKMPVSIVMTRMPNLIYAEEDESILSGVKKIIKHQIDSLPVVKVIETEDEIVYKVVGRFTKTNTTKLLMGMLEKKVQTKN